MTASHPSQALTSRLRREANQTVCLKTARFLHTDSADSQRYLCGYGRNISGRPAQVAAGSTSIAILLQCKLRRRRSLAMLSLKSRIPPAAAVAAPVESIGSAAKASWLRQFLGSIKRSRRGTRLGLPCKLNLHQLLKGGENRGGQRFTGMYPPTQAARPIDAIINQKVVHKTT